MNVAQAAPTSRASSSSSTQGSRSRTRYSTGLAGMAASQARMPAAKSAAISTERSS
jgi:hypothetical protein